LIISFKSANVNVAAEIGDGVEEEEGVGGGVRRVEEDGEVEEEIGGVVVNFPLTEFADFFIDVEDDDVSFLLFTFFGATSLTYPHKWVVNSSQGKDTAKGEAAWTKRKLAIPSSMISKINCSVYFRSFCTLSFDKRVRLRDIFLSMEMWDIVMEEGIALTKGKSKERKSKVENQHSREGENIES
jgi:hypothetical protein